MRADSYMMCVPPVSPLYCLQAYNSKQQVYAFVNKQASAFYWDFSELPD